MAINRRSMLLATFTALLLVGCRYELDTTHAAPEVAEQIVQTLLNAATEADVVGNLTPLIGQRLTEGLALDWLTLVDGQTNLTTGANHVVISHDITNANIDILASATPIGRIRIVTTPTDNVLRVDVLRAWDA